MAVFHPRTRLDSFIEGVLTPSARARVSAHLDECSDCRREAGQRERIIRAASSLGPAPERAAAPGAVRRPGDDPATGSVPVLERREGVAGWKVVLGVGAAGLVASGVLASAWVAGAPSAAEPDQAQVLPFAGDPVQAGQDGAAPPPSAPASRVPDTAVGPGASASSGPGAATAPSHLAPAGSILSATAGITPDATVVLSPSRVTDLRQAGWNVPRFHGLGMVSESTGWHRGDGVAEVVMTMSDDRHELEFHECRALWDGDAVPSCPVPWEGGTAPSGSAADDSADSGGAVGGVVSRDGGEGAGVAVQPAPGSGAWVGAEVVELPVGVDMLVREHAEGSWTATVATGQAGYAVVSDLPVESAPRVMSMVVISERSRLQGGSAPETAGDRLARGFERLLPWWDAEEPRRR